MPKFIGKVSVTERRTDGLTLNIEKLRFYQGWLCPLAGTKVAKEKIVNYSDYKRNYNNILDILGAQLPLIR